MSWVYVQSSGALCQGPRVVGIGYSGFGDFKNDPSAENHKDMGPIPRGRYAIDGPIDTETHGPYVLALEPDPTNEMFERDGFLIHGDSRHVPGSASHGCIIVPWSIRKEIWESGDHELIVVAE